MTKKDLCAAQKVSTTNSQELSRSTWGFVSDRPTFIQQVTHQELVANRPVCLPAGGLCHSCLPWVLGTGADLELLSASTAVRRTTTSPWAQEPCRSSQPVDRQQVPRVDRQQVPRGQLQGGYAGVGGVQDTAGWSELRFEGRTGMCQT